jgi:uncharacterized protein (DUF697 family)/tellurite resistance protein
MKLPPHDSISSEPLLAICLFAAFADGEKSDAEREEIRRIADDLGSDNLAALTRQILMGKGSLDTAVAELHSRSERMLAYEMARGVCESGGSISPAEAEFLKSLHSKLNLNAADSEFVEIKTSAITRAPVELTDLPTTRRPDNSGMILKYSILNGALELLPDTLATMAIIPMQMKMVYRIGKSHGVELDRSSIKEFLATAGLGFGSQVLEGFARKLMGGLAKKTAGKMAGKTANHLTGSAFSFASTYAIGHLAEQYHSAGRKLSSSEMKSIFIPLKQKAGELHQQYLPEIQNRAQSLDAASILNLVRGKSPA